MPAERNAWDPDGLLNSNAVFSVVGRLSWRLSIDGKWLKGYISDLETYPFTLIGTDGIHSVPTCLTIKVIPPTTTPLIGSEGRITGVPDAAGDYHFLISVKDWGGY